jgi:Na+/proline symporter
VRRLLIANIALAALLAAHVADHTLRQPAGDQLGLLASLPGLLGTVAVFVSLGLLVRGTRHAAQFAGVVGLLTALGFVAVHLAPHWSMFSDPYADRYLDAGSWIEMLAALACGLLVAIEALRVCRAQQPGGAPPRAPQLGAG